MIKKKGLYFFLFLFIIWGAISLRTVGLNWDQGYYLHPDERMIFIVAHRLKLPKNINEFFHHQSPLNPKFFAYGSLPIYLLKLSSWLAGWLVNKNLATFSESFWIGRIISVLFELGTIIFIAKIAQKISNSKAAILSTLFYSVSVLPIQLAHFYTVDIPLTFFLVGTIYFSLCFIEQQKKKFLILSGMFLGMALASKISALPFTLVIIGSCLTTKLPKKKRLSQIATHLLLGGVAAILAFLITSPYALIDHTTFIEQIKEQQIITKDPFVFPYTLQYVNTPPYLYQLKNYFLWGVGPFLAITSWLSYFILKLRIAKKVFLKQKINQKDKKIALILGIIAIYFIIIGQFSVKFMRYLMPLYPLLALASALILVKKSLWFSLIIFLPSFAWAIAFISIYTKPHSRIEASVWINQNVPPGSTIAIEHWDDRLPLFSQHQYQFEVLELYQPESEQKWQKINQQLSKADYLIIASQRLYLPLSKLTDCSFLPPQRCYQETAQYYQKLFSGHLIFQEEVKFHYQPTLKIGPKSFIINDFGADESFTVYDHPPVVIFKK